MSVENPEYMHLSVFRSLAGIPPPPAQSADILLDFDPLVSPRQPDNQTSETDTSHKNGITTSTASLIASFMETDLDPARFNESSDSETDSEPGTSSDILNNNNEQPEMRLNRAENVMSMADTISLNTQFGAYDDFREVCYLIDVSSLGALFIQYSLT